MQAALFCSSSLGEAHSATATAAAFTAFCSFVSGFKQEGHWPVGAGYEARFFLVPVLVLVPEPAPVPKPTLAPALVLAPVSAALHVVVLVFAPVPEPALAPALVLAKEPAAPPVVVLVLAPALAPALVLAKEPAAPPVVALAALLLLAFAPAQKRGASSLSPRAQCRQALLHPYL